MSKPNKRYSSFENAFNCLAALLSLMVLAACPSPKHNDPSSPEKAKNPAQADVTVECTPIDLSDKLGPVRDQGTKGWCYADTAADLIGFYLGITPEKQVSAIDVAASYSLGDATEMRSKIPNLVQRKSTLSDDVRRWDLGRQVDSFEQRQKDWKGTPFGDRNGGYEALAIGMYNLKDGVCTEDQLPQSLAQTVNITKDFLKDRCRDRIPISKYLLLIENNSAPLRERPKDAAGTLDVGLQNAQPVGIDYRACFLQKKPDIECEHASVVVARRMRAGVCEYRIRNSWGTSCDYYRDDLRANCANGHVWVTRKELRENLDSATFIVPYD